MKPIQTKGVVLSRTDFGEADRIVTVLTSDQGKLRLMVRGVRKMKSKLAGGIELFSTSDLTYIKGKGEIDTLISARLIRYYASIVQDIERVQLGYQLIKALNRATEDEPEPEYFYLLENSFKALDNSDISIELIRLWFQAQLLGLAGHSPNLTTDVANKKLEPGRNYNFDLDDMAFVVHQNGRYNSNDIKFLRLVFAKTTPETLIKVHDAAKFSGKTASLVKTIFQDHIRQ